MNEMQMYPSSEFQRYKQDFTIRDHSRAQMHRLLRFILLNGESLVVFLVSEEEHPFHQTYSCRDRSLENKM